jgi:hypothetical protein
MKGGEKKDLKIKINKKLILILVLSTFLSIMITISLLAQPAPIGTAKIYGYTSYQIGAEKEFPDCHAICFL